MTAQITVTLGLDEWTLATAAVLVVADSVLPPSADRLRACVARIDAQIGEQVAPGTAKAVQS